MPPFYYNSFHVIVPNLLESQQTGFQRFLFEGISRELYYFSTKIDHNLPTVGKIRIWMEHEKWALEKVPYGEFWCQKNRYTYGVWLSVPIVIEHELGHKKRSRVRLGKIPMMDGKGGFLINGVPRAVIHQVLRAPGIYFQSRWVGNKKKKKKRKRCYSATLISESGTWLRIEKDPRGRVWLWVKRNNKVSILLLLGLMGYECIDDIQVRMFHSFIGVEGSDFLLPSLRWWQEDDDLGDHLPTIKWCLIHLYDAVFQGPFRRDLSLYILVQIENNSSFRSGPSLYKEMWEEGMIQNELIEKRLYLGRLGRFNVERRLGLPSVCNRILSATQSQIIHPLLDNFVEIEHDPALYFGYNDLLRVMHRLALFSYGDEYQDDIDHLKNKRVLSVGELMQQELHRGMKNLITYAANSEKWWKRPRKKRYKKYELALGWWDLTVQDFFPMTHVSEGLKRFFVSHPLSQFMDQTNGLSHLAQKRRMSCLGPGGLTRQTASFRIRDIHPSQYGRVCPIETPEGTSAGLVSSLASHAKVSRYGSLCSPLRPVSAPPTLTSFRYVSSQYEEKHWVSTGDRMQNSRATIVPARYQQEFVTAEWDQISLIDIFPIQYFSIASSLIPFLEHNDANRVLMGANMQRQALPLLSLERAIVGTGMEWQVAFESGTLVKAKEPCRAGYVDAMRIITQGREKTGTNDSLVRFNQLSTYQRSNQNTCLHQRPLISMGEYVDAGETIADGSVTVGGQLALGKNVLVAYTPWEGYNFEDAVLINERMVYDHVYTSIQIEKHQVTICETEAGPELVTREVPHLREHFLRHLDPQGIIKVGSWVETGDVLVGRLVPKGRGYEITPEERLLAAIFGERVVTMDEKCLRVPPRGRGRVVDAHWVHQEDASFGRIQSIYVHILQRRAIQVGDKVAGRHGNKGIISKILPREDMPHLQDGTPLDMVLSPLGVPSRMNVGQLFECLLGLAGSLLGKHYRIMPFDERCEQEASRKLVLSQLWEARAYTSHRWAFESDSLGKSHLLDGRTGDVFEQPATIGKAYMLKLVHQVDDKIHARSTGPYSKVTQQPLRGRSKKGGQRIGEMEAWALEGFGAANTLQEMFTLKSDDMLGRNNLLNAIIEGRPIPHSPSDLPEACRLLLWELRALCVRTHILHTTIFYSIRA
uniref:RNA polymerase beta subunit n=1 Tax=Klebsormidium crenulatum TaxID=424406 RepID=UPI00286C27B9|nr:RNA polymerase beta subunit [Klebsormidium crenulatum]WKT06349.1 RNA polymerase beta subunit [Klebsormidium crenulatum]